MKIISKKTVNGRTTVEAEVANMFDGKRIYCVVADTVQHPLGRVEAPFRKTYPMAKTIKRGPDTRNIPQIAGRLMAQGEHVVSKVRHKMLLDEVLRAQAAARKAKSHDVWMRGQIVRFQGITTINLACRDSFELYHIKGLLDGAGIKNEFFYDENEAVYGKGKVLTAVATHPVHPDEVYGILDYLPLWYRPEKAL